MIANQKKELRKTIKNRKAQLSEEERLAKSAAVFNQIEQLEVFKNAKIVLLYWSMDDEIHTHDFINKWWKLKTILLPAVDGAILKLKTFCGKETMQPGQLMGIPEPGGQDFNNTETIDLIIVPGIAFDRKNYRMGRGRGFYDKLLSGIQNKKIGICFNFQLLENIPTETHDIPMDYVIYA